MRKLFLLVVCFFFSPLFSHSLFLINDSLFELNALVHAATGDFLGQESLQPGEQKQWNSEMKRTPIKEIYNSKGSTTPFTVTWQCAYEGVYSVSQNISPGQVVKSSQGEGSRTCRKKTDKTDDKCPPCPICPSLSTPHKERSNEKN